MVFQVPCILIVEDNRSVSDIISRILIEQSYLVVCAYDCIAAKEIIDTQKIDLAIIDINLSEADRSQGEPTYTHSKRESSEVVCVEGEEGFHLTAWIQHFHPQIGSIILTDRDSLDDQIYGRDLGADDYAIKSIQHSDLQSRIRSLLRRLGCKPSNTVVFGNWEFDLDREALTRIGSSISPTNVTVSLTEARLLRILATRIGSIVSRRTLCSYVFKRELGEKDRAVDNLVSKLRSRLDEGLGAISSHITTVHGAGYRLEPFVVGHH